MEALNPYRHSQVRPLSYLKYLGLYICFLKIFSRSSSAVESVSDYDDQGSNDNPPRSSEDRDSPPSVHIIRKSPNPPPGGLQSASLTSAGSSSSVLLSASSPSLTTVAMTTPAVSYGHHRLLGCHGSGGLFGGLLPLLAPPGGVLGDKNRLDALTLLGSTFK